MWLIFNPVVDLAASVLSEQHKNMKHYDLHVVQDFHCADCAKHELIIYS